MIGNLIIHRLDGVDSATLLSLHGAYRLWNCDGSMVFNILTRTSEMVGREGALRTGPASIAAPIPERELQETRAKTRGLLRAPSSSLG